MFMGIFRKIFKSYNERYLKGLSPIVDKINRLEADIRKLSDAELQAKTWEFKDRIAQGASLDDLLPEAFAVVREVSRRVLGMRPFDVQLVGGIVLHQGKIAEMKTGEGKTLVATMPVYLNALLGRGVHVVTVNDYLAKRDSEWMGKIYKFLGLSVGCIVHGLEDSERKEAYKADVTYGTNNEFGFDYLRDNMKFRLEDMVQRELYYAIVDEVDSILIDEARTPLIISGPSEKSTELYYRINRIIPRLKKDVHFTVDEKSNTVALTEEGVAKVEELLGVNNLYDPKNIDLIHHVNQALKAHYLFKRDVHYVVKSGKVIIVDEFTGRLMPGRRYSDGLHQALEAKEGVRIENENQTLATITFQNYFRMYEKLAGMTGTAETESEEFAKIYNLDVIVIPTHKKMIRVDYPDCIYKTEKEKFKAVVEEIKELHKQGRPVLVGTVSIEKSERLSAMLKRAGIPHQVLNAKHHEKEAEIIARAGQRGAVTISTNMAGRGTDIVLGEGVAELGGLHVIGTERHESRRIDNQLRGRAGRQGDPGSSRFYLSLEDDLMRIFASDRIARIMDKVGMEEGVPIENKIVTRAIENAQKQVEAYNFSIRKQLLEFDDVMNHQREIIYKQRKEALAGGNLKEVIHNMIYDVIDLIVEEYCNEELGPDEWDIESLKKEFSTIFGFVPDASIAENGKTLDELKENLIDQAIKRYSEREKELGEDLFRQLESFILLQNVDNHWKDHLLSMDHLKEGIGLRGYGQEDPLVAYKREAHQLFDEMIQRIKTDTVRMLFHIQIQREDEIREIQREQESQPMYYGGGDAGSVKRQPVRSKKKVGRNEPCPCGSGKKYKKCCGR